ncbi:gamma-glutamyltransferase family protein [Neorhizobium sp. P12A]|uniref:gamma-glutamyltransferase family protein n=1 Tax=Rhizobium/Agrobacterium group TaxID=227290 RepID=UPI00104F5908|nr:MULTISPECIES: gamma-glutamyltransferase [Rhizobium/Agrobacterium group]KAA0697809.1 gamma-glutamyltransferase family protein [Neorhizobium sp. P12A]TCR87990.1 gamma-glutamyltransferase 2 [Rhizobium sp. BK376]
MVSFTTRPELSGTFGAVSSTHWLGTSVGMSVLERGGNAFDAAAACGFTLQIVEPHLNGPGGEVPIILKSVKEDEPVVICGQGVSPALASLEAFRSLGLEMVPGTGLLPAVVPGSFDAWMLLLRDYGTLPLEDILSYAIAYAESGFPLLPRAVASIIPVEDLFRNEWPSSAEVWLPHNRVPKPGAVMHMPAIAATYRRILAEAKAAGSDRVVQIEAARRAFYQGFVADAIDRFYRTAELFDTTGRRNPGLLRGEDLSNWSATKEKTLSRDFHGLTVHKTGPWGQGPVFLQQLALLSQLDIGSFDPYGPDFVHTVVESAKLCFADREAFYGDPNTSDIPIDILLSDDYVRERAKLVGPEASQQLIASHLPGAAERLARIAARAGSEVPQGPGGGEVTFAAVPEIEGDTVHLDIVDRFGNMISATPSGGWLQSSPVVPGLGFPISTRAQMFWLDEGLPSTLRPGTRPRTTLTPTLVTRDGEGYLAIGTPGGDQQDQWPLTVFLRHILHRQGLQSAIDAPMFHSKHWPGSFYPREYELGRLLIEDRYSASTLASLRERSHRLSVQDSWSLGRVCAVERSNGLLYGASTPRHMQSYAIVR